MQFPVKRRGRGKKNSLSCYFRAEFAALRREGKTSVVAAKHGIEEEGKAAISGIGGPRSAQARQRRV